MSPEMQSLCQSFRSRLHGSFRARSCVLGVQERPIPDSPLPACEQGDQNEGMPDGALPALTSNRGWTVPSGVTACWRSKYGASSVTHERNV